MAKIVFRARNFTKIYRTGAIEVAALQGVDLDLFAGELIVLLGPSGSGNSTLLNILGGLDHATSGEVHFLDHDLTDLSDRGLTEYRRDHVGFVFQFYNLISSLTARENVALVTEIAIPCRQSRRCRAANMRKGAATGRRESLIDASS